MDRNQAKEFYPILQAFAEGKVIECRTKPSAVEGTDIPNDWTEMTEIEFWNNTEYRIKPEPKYRSFKNAKECWNEMQKHQPIGWVKHKFNPDNVISTVHFLDNRKDFKIYVNYDRGQSPFDMMTSFVFADGTPFGVKVEEE